MKSGYIFENRVPNPPPHGWFARLRSGFMGLAKLEPEPNPADMTAGCVAVDFLSFISKGYVDYT